MKFDTLLQNLLEATQKPSKLPYKIDSDGDVWWTRKGGNLEGAPEKVGGDFSCSDNQLQSLEGAPEKVGGDFYCDQNPLTSLKGIPEAKRYFLPDGFTEKDAIKEIERRRFRKDLDKETAETWGDFVDQL